ncbi:MAG TPA: serine/threonine-protein kinase, partial [Catenuloplanes sp.]
MTQIPTWSGGHANPTTGRAAPGTMIGGRYTLRAAVGHGGMGTVWRAADTLLRRDVAVKEVILPPGLAPTDREAMYERTLREARAAAALQHPAVVQVYDVVHEAGRPWIVMELLDARSLADMVIEDGPLNPRAVAKIGIALLGALEVAHAIGVLHRDVKPANVLICADGRCVLTDFGVARMPTEVQLTTPGMVLGSPHFISPERAMGSDFGPPSDLFSLGVTLYTAVEGRPPFDKGDPIETMHSVVEDPPAPMVRAGALANVLPGLLEKDPARRYDVPTSRSLLRQLLAGPLASQAPGHLMTDPYAVVPAQRPPVTTQPIPPPQPSGQIGGRAMLSPDESLTDRLAKLRRAGRERGTAADAAAAAGGAAAAGAGGAAAGGAVGTGGRAAAGAGATAAATAVGGIPPVGTTAADRTAAHPTRPGPAHSGPTHSGPAHSGPAHSGPAGGAAGGNAAGGAHPSADRHSEVTTRLGAGGPLPRSVGGETTSVIPPRHHWQTVGTASSPPQGSVVLSRGARRGAALRGAVDGVRRAGVGAVGTVRAWPRNAQLATGAGAVIIVLLTGVILSTGGTPDPKGKAPVAQSAAPVQADFPTQQFAERGVTVNVPDGWEKSTTKNANWVDFIDPKDNGRKVRILVESSSAEPARFMEIAENTLRKSKACPKPYQRVDLRDAQVGGRPSAE